MNAIIPDLIFLGFTYMGFFVDRHVVPGRVGLLSMTLLVERTLINSIYSSLPEISYHCWLLDYLIVSFVLVFVSAAEYAVVSVYLAREKAAGAFKADLRQHGDAVADFIARVEAEDRRPAGERHRSGLELAEDAAPRAADAPLVPRADAAAAARRCCGGGAARVDAPAAKRRASTLELATVAGEVEVDVPVAEPAHAPKIHAIVGFVVKAYTAEGAHGTDEPLTAARCRALLSRFEVCCSARAFDHVWANAPRSERGDVGLAEFLQLLESIDRRLEHATYAVIGSRYAVREHFMALDRSLRLDQGSKRVRNSQLRRLISRPFSTRFG